MRKPSSQEAPGSDVYNRIYAPGEWFQLPRDFFHLNLSHHEIHVLAVLANHSRIAELKHNKKSPDDKWDGWFHTPSKDIVEELNTYARIVSDDIAELAHMGYIEVKRKGLPCVNFYRLCPKDIHDVATGRRDPKDRQKKPRKPKKEAETEGVPRCAVFDTSGTVENSTSLITSVIEEDKDKKEEPPYPPADDGDGSGGARRDVPHQRPHPGRPEAAPTLPHGGPSDPRRDPPAPLVEDRGAARPPTVPVDRSDEGLANGLYRALRRKQRATKPKSLRPWARAFASLREEVGDARLHAAYDWYVENVGGPYVPEAHSAVSFASKFIGIESAMRRLDERRQGSAGVILCNTPSEDTLALVRKMTDAYFWPQGVDLQLPAAVQASFDSLDDFLRGRFPLPSGGPLEALHGHVRACMAPEPYELIEIWLRRLHARLCKEGTKAPTHAQLTFTVDNREFRASLRDLAARTAGHSRLADQLVDAYKQHKGWK